MYRFIMEIYLEEIKKENEFVTVFDDDGMVTIQMSEVSLSKIIDVFDKFITDGKNHKDLVEVTEFGNTFKLDLSLSFEEDGFNLTGCILNSNFYHDFELEYCDIETWNKIKGVVSK
jgi:hypothetical protein